MFMRLRKGVAPMVVMKMMENRLIALGTMSHMTKPVWKMGPSCACAMLNARASNALTSGALEPRDDVRSGCGKQVAGGAGAAGGRPADRVNGRLIAAQVARR
jgi:hypothetical protein